MISKVMLTAIKATSLETQLKGYAGIKERI